MILNKQQKEAMIIELLENGLGVQQIAKQAHASFTTIKEIRDKITVDLNDKAKKIYLFHPNLLNYL